MDKNIILRQSEKLRQTKAQKEHAETFEPLVIPPEAYKEFRRCPHCESVFIDDNKCEACGKVLNFNPLGAPLSSKSLYGLKEKYVDNLPLISRFISSIENKQSPLALNYKRHLDKRFSQLLEAFSNEDIISKKERKLFYNELKDIITEKLEMDFSVRSIEDLIEKKLSEKNTLMSQELMIHLHQEAQKNQSKEQVFGLKKSFILKTIVTLSFLTFFCFMAVMSISSLDGK